MKDVKTKSLKISETVHKKLKMYIAETGGNMTEFADGAILSKLAINKVSKNKKIAG